MPGTVAAGADSRPLVRPGAAGVVTGRHKLAAQDATRAATRGRPGQQQRRCRGPRRPGRGCAGGAVHRLGLPRADAGRLRDGGAPRLRRRRGHGHHGPDQPGPGRPAPAVGLSRRPGAGRARPVPADHPAGLGPRAVGQAEPGQGGGGEARRQGRRGASAVPLAARVRRDFEAGPGPARRRRPTSSSRSRTCTRCGARGRRGDRVRAALEPGRDRLPRTSRSTSRTPRCPAPTRWPWPSELGGRLAHVHMADGTAPGLPDEHLVPGRGTQPCAELLASLAPAATPGWSCSR